MHWPPGTLIRRMLGRPDPDDDLGAWPVRRGQVRAISLPAGVTLRADLPYGPDPGHRFDVYLPPGAPTCAPVLLMVHGGGWRRGDKAAPAVIGHKVVHWTQKGWVVASMNYRLDPGVSPIEQAEDVARAMAFVVDHAADWGADADQLVLMGHSAGAHLAALLTSDRSLSTGVGGPAQWRATVALDSAAFDVVAIMSRPHLPLYDSAFGDNRDAWASMSPIHRLRPPTAAPMLIVCSSRRPEACRPCHDYAARANGLAGRVSVLEVDAGHRELNQVVGAINGTTQAIDAFLTQATGA